MMGSRKTYLIFGVVFALFGTFYLFIALMAKGSLAPQAYVTFALAVMSFCMSYLFTHLKMKDERSRIIREKGMFYAYFAMLGYFFIFMTLLTFNVIEISALTTVNILVALMIATVFISMVIVAKRN